MIGYFGSYRPPTKWERFVFRCIVAFIALVLLTGLATMGAGVVWLCHHVHVSIATKP